MSSKIGHMTNLEGDRISVTFSGSEVAQGEFELVDVMLQIDGGAGEYIPVQYATASITCCVDALELIDLCTKDPLDVAVRIVNETKGVVLFAGYVSPNTYNQQIDGVADLLTIECVDWLGIAKCVTYMRPGGLYSTRMLWWIVENVISQISSTADSRVMFGNSVRLVNGDGTEASDRYYWLEAATNYFFEDPDIPVMTSTGSMSLVPNAMSCYDVLEMIASSFRLRFIQVGLDVILSDDIRLATDGEERLVVNSVEGSVATHVIGREIAIDADAIASSGTQISVIPRVDSFRLDKEYGVVKVSPALFAPETLLPTGGIKTEGLFDDGWHVVQLLKSKLVDMSEEIFPPVGGETLDQPPNAMFVGCCTYEGNDMSYNDGNPITAYGAGNNSWSTYIRIFSPPEPENYIDEPLATFHKEFQIPVVPSSRMTLRLTMTAAVEADSTEYFPTQPAGSELTPGIIPVALRCGDQYYDPDARSWVNGRVRINLELEGGTWKKGVINAMLTSTMKGLIDVEILPRWKQNPKNVHSVAYIKELKVELVPDLIGQSSVAYYRTDKETIGTYIYDRKAEAVVLPLSFGVPIGPRPLSTYISNEDWAAASMSKGVPTRIYTGIEFSPSASNASRYTMVERLQRQGNKGDGREYIMTVRDSNNTIDMMTTFTCDLWSGRRAIAGLVKNLRDSSVVVTLD